MDGLRFADPLLLALAALVPVGLWMHFRRGEPAVKFGPGGLLKPEGGRPFPRTWRVRFHRLPWLLTALGLLLAVVALARPVQRVAIPHRTEGIDILLCLDISSSMAANDLDPDRSRLEVARDSALRFIAGRPDDRIGLICFARYPDLRCPLTTDHRALGELIEAVDPVENDGPEDATGIGTATLRAAQVLDSGAADSRVVVLFTDGEENVATADKPEEIAPLHAGQLCAKLRVRVFVIAAGLGRRNSAGEWVALDTRQVRSLSERTGGRLFEARDAEAVGGVYREIDQLTKAEFEKPEFETRERFPPFLVAALVLLLLGRLLLASPRGVLP